MNPKSGKAGTVVTPLEPMSPHAADKADPGEMAEVKANQLKSQTGKYGATPTKPLTPPESEEEKQQKKSWIEIELVDQEDVPVAGEPYRVTLPDGETVAEGTLDDKGFARIDGIEPGTCQITFPNMDRSSWKPA